MFFWLLGTNGLVGICLCREYLDISAGRLSWAQLSTWHVNVAKKKSMYAVTSSGYRKLIEKILKLFMKSVRLFGIFCLKFLHQFLASKILNAHIVFAVISLVLYKTNFKQSYDLQQTDDIAQIRSWTKKWERWKEKHTRDTHAHSAKAPEWMNVGYVKHAFERKTKSHPKIEKNWKTFPLKLLMTFVSLNCLLSHPTRYIFLAQIFYLSLHKTIKWAIAWLGLALVGFWKSRKGWRPVFDSWWIMWAFIKLNIFECSAIHWKSTEMCVLCASCWAIAASLSGD